MEDSSNASPPETCGGWAETLVRRDILGHSSGSMTGDYTHASPEAMEEAMELVAGFTPRRLPATTKWHDKIAG